MEDLVLKRVLNRLNDIMAEDTRKFKFPISNRNKYYEAIEDCINIIREEMNNMGDCDVD
jgi:2-phosphoglycerate kinase